MSGPPLSLRLYALATSLAEPLAPALLKGRARRGKEDAARMGERDWVGRFTAAAVPGAYLRVVTPGVIRAGDRLEIVRRPDHEVTIGVTFRAMTLEPDLWPLLLRVDALPEPIRERARRRVGGAAGPSGVASTDD